MGTGCRLLENAPTWLLETSSRDMTRDIANVPRVCITDRVFRDYRSIAAPLINSTHGLRGPSFLSLNRPPLPRK